MSADRIADLLSRLGCGDARALARAISIVEDGAAGAAELLRGCRARRCAGLRLGVTGPPGAGKSTLVDRLIHALRRQGKTVAVLAIDPSSATTGGALLGDRIRMQGFSGDAGVYIRSMASRGATGGLTAAAEDACAVVEASGRDVLIVETVGAGQSEVEIAGVVDLTLVVLVPGMGDDVQSLKAGMLEIADVFVLNKADLEGADRTEAEIVAAQSLSSAPAPRIVRTVATTGQGIEELLEEIERLSQRIAADPGRRLRRGNGKTSQPALDHIGIAVRSIASAREVYGLLGLAVSREETIQHEQVATAMLPLGDTRIELLEPTVDDSTIGRFLARRGPGLHHIAIRAAGIDGLFASLQAQGVRLASDCVRSGAGGHRYFFLHPESTGGVLLEIVEGEEVETDRGQ